MLPTSRVAKAALQTCSKRTACNKIKIGNIIPWMNYTACPPVRGERGNLAAGKTGIPKQHPFLDAMEYLKRNSTLRVYAKYTYFVVGLAAVVWLTMDTENKAYFTSNRDLIKERNARHAARYTPAPPFVRPEPKAQATTEAQPETNNV